MSAHQASMFAPLLAKVGGSYDQRRHQQPNEHVRYEQSVFHFDRSVHAPSLPNTTREFCRKAQETSGGRDPTKSSCGGFATPLPIKAYSLFLT